jgi:FMN reductase
MVLVSISGSPSSPSRSAWLLRHAVERAGERVGRFHTISVRDLPAQALVHCDTSHAAIARSHRTLAEAQAVLIGTPIYKAAYSGLLKLFLDGLPAGALRGKPVLALATGGSPGHLLALDYALKPVLSALGARTLIESIYAVDTQLVPDALDGYVPDAALIDRLDQSLELLLQQSHHHVPSRRRAPRIDPAEVAVRLHC